MQTHLLGPRSAAHLHTIRRSPVDAKPSGKFSKRHFREAKRLVAMTYARHGRRSDLDGALILRVFHGTRRFPHEPWARET
jgi:hypothetical protein